MSVRDDGYGGFTVGPSGGFSPPETPSNLTPEQVVAERERRLCLSRADMYIDGVARGRLLREAATQEAIKCLMVGSHAGRCGKLPRSWLLGDG